MRLNTQILDEAVKRTSRKNSKLNYRYYNEKLRKFKNRSLFLTLLRETYTTKVHMKPSIVKQLIIACINLKTGTC